MPACGLEQEPVVRTVGDAKNVSELIALSKEATYLPALAHVEGENVLWRGHSLEEYKLCPSIHRVKVYIEQEGDEYMLEDMAYQKMEEASVKRARKLIQSYNELDENQLLSRLQHYGCPTSLLDWSESVLVAALFACLNPSKWGKPGAVWCYIHQFDTEAIQIIEPRWDTVRQSRQLAWHTKHGFYYDLVTKIEMGMEDLLPVLRSEYEVALEECYDVHENVRVEKNSGYLRKIVINNKESLIKELFQIGIKPTNINPDEVGIGQELNIEAHFRFAELQKRLRHA